LLLIYFKYALVLFEGLVGGEGGQFWMSVTSTLLPIGISFYTIQQIAYQFDAFQRRARHSLLEYAAYVAFFPTLISGPLVYHSELVPQLGRVARRVTSRAYMAHWFAPAMALFVIGLAKKVLIADPLAGYVDHGYIVLKAGGLTPNFIESWGLALGFAAQIYFDFSSCSDMAIALAGMFAIALPVNFHSPYKARSLIEFWHRWHITLTRFLTTCLYTPVSFVLARWCHRHEIGGAARFILAAMVPLFLTMLASGVWHGVGVTFVLFGAIHGALITANHLLRRVSKWKPPAVLGIAVTFLIMVATLALFRSESVEQAAAIWRGMFGFEGIGVPPSHRWIVDALGPVARLFDIHAAPISALTLTQLGFIAGSLVIVFAFPNAMVLLDPVRRRPLMRSGWFAWWIGLLLVLSLFQVFVSEARQFAYFQF
jgi:D-alanyl-lipoteichoic acid acyltransferase DltB (MBOAT superfamily)